MFIISSKLTLQFCPIQDYQTLFITSQSNCNIFACRQLFQTIVHPCRGSTDVVRTSLCDSTVHGFTVLDVARMRSRRWPSHLVTPACINIIFARSSRPPSTVLSSLWSGDERSTAKRIDIYTSRNRPTTEPTPKPRAHQLSSATSCPPDPPW